MSRKKSEDQDKIESLEEQIRNLKSIIKSLVRKLKKIDKKFVYNELQETETSSKFEDIKKKLKQCPYCKQISIEEFQVAGRKIGKCTSCGKRTKAEKV
jgi:hypothetical protein